MNINIIENKKNLLVIDLEDASHEICLGLKETLLKSSDVVVATFRVDHPQIRKARFYLETKGKVAESVFKDAIKAIQKDNKKILTSIEKLK